jgi:RNA polymerase sigma factor (sigma-70 family)
VPRTRRAGKDRNETPKHHRNHYESGRSPRNSIVQNIDFVNNVARRVQRRVPPCVTFDDLVSVGMIGLIQAVDRFDASRDLQFKTYAQHRIWGAMLDFLREEDPLSRTERRRVRESAAGLSATGHGIQPVTVSLDQISLRRLAAPAQAADAQNRSEHKARNKSHSVVLLTEH